MEVTLKALKRITDLRSEWNDVLRVKVVGGGCSGMSYKMEWIKELNEHDKFMAFPLDEGDKQPLHIVVDAKSYLFLKDVILDFEDGLNGGGFTWNNPGAKRTCGCGSSFSV